MARPNISWHFPRATLAKTYLDGFETGLLSAYALFAPRRHGKTEFLAHDITPAAIARGYSVAYVNLWDNKESPASALINALRHAVAARSIVKRVSSRATDKLKKLKFGGKIAALGEASAEFEWDRPERQNAGLAELHQLLAGAARQRYPTLLLIDEAHVLADTKNETLAASLRSGLDIRKDSIKVIFTGSSETALRRMFGQIRLPFYNWAPIEAFPLLGKEFVQHQVETFNAISSYRLSTNDALRAFTRLHGVPEYFRRFMDDFLRLPFEGVEAALARTQGKIQSDRNYPGIWSQLKAVDRIVLQLVVAGDPALLSLATRSHVGEMLGMDAPVGAPAMQNALRRLLSAQMLVRLGQGSYRLEDAQFAQWIEESDAPD